MKENGAIAANDKTVRQLHHTLLWPVQLRSLRRDQGAGVTHYWDILQKNPAPWTYVTDALLIEDDSCVVGYGEFVYFLPYVQRFLYGVGDEGRGAQSSLHIFTRDDIKQMRVTLKPNAAPITLDVLRMRLYFFYDIDVALVAMEVAGSELPLDSAIDLLDRLGRPYPPTWETSPRGEIQGAHCPYLVEIFGENGKLLVTSDYGDQKKYLNLVRNQRQTPLAVHWEYLLAPLVPAYSEGGSIKFYQLENKRVPIMSYLSFDDPHGLSRGDMIRLGFSTKWGESDTTPYAAPFLKDFEAEYCYDRYWDANDSTRSMNTRYFFCGQTFTMITQHGTESVSQLKQFRHHFFQIGLIAHFHKAALLSMSNRFSRAVERMNVRDFESVKQFKRHVRETLEVFLRFNHRYWFHEISNQVQASDFFKRWSHQLGSDALYNEVREEARDINEYLDADRARKSTDNAMRLTVVSACGMVGTIVTGFLGMNLYSHSDLPMLNKILIFIAVFIPTTVLSLYTVILSRRIASFMEALSSEGLTWKEKFATFRQIWGVDKRKIVRERRAGSVLTSGDD
jgi:CorA-like Mg2+ transporter protein